MTDRQEKGRSPTKKIAPDAQPQSNLDSIAVDPLVSWFRLGKGVKAKPKKWNRP